MPAPWTEPRTWSFEEVVTAAQLNEQLRDNLKHIGPDSGTFAKGYAEDVVVDHGADPTGAADSTAAFNAALAAGDWIVGPPDSRYLIQGALDGTDRTGLEIDLAGSELIGETGSAPVLDLTNTKDSRFRNFVIDAGSNTPSKIGIAHCRNSTKQSCGSNLFENVDIWVASDPAANGGYGAVAYYNIGSEVNTYVNCDFGSDVALAANGDNFLGFSSSFTDTIAQGDPTTMAQLWAYGVRLYGWRFPLDITGQMFQIYGFLGPGVTRIGGGPLASDAVAIRSGVSRFLWFYGSVEGHDRAVEWTASCLGGEINAKYHQASSGEPVMRAEGERKGPRGMRLQWVPLASDTTVPLLQSSSGKTFDLVSNRVYVHENQTVDLAVSGAGGDRSFANEFIAADNGATEPTITLTSADSNRGNRLWDADGEKLWDGSAWNIEAHDDLPDALVDPHVENLGQNNKSESDLPSTYPSGISRMAVTEAFASSDWTSIGNSGALMTVFLDTNRFHQFFYANGGGMWFRGRFGPDEWSGWSSLRQLSALTAEDTATVDSTYGTDEAGVIENLRTRVGELESRLQTLGVLP